MEIVTKIKNELKYDPNTGIIKWKEHGNGRRPDLVAGCVRRKGDNIWRKIVLNGKGYMSSQIAWVLQTGEFPTFIIDHIDGDSLNDKWDNLRRGDNCVSQRNAKKDRRNRSGIPGVRFYKGTYLAYIGNGKTQEYLDCTKDFFEACCKRKSAERKYNYSLRHGQ